MTTTKVNSVFKYRIVCWNARLFNYI